MDTSNGKAENALLDGPLLAKWWDSTRWPRASTKCISIIISLACFTSEIWPGCDRPPSRAILEA